MKRTNSEATSGLDGKKGTPIPAVVEEYLQMIESGKPRPSAEQIALAKMIRTVFRDETLNVDQTQLERYLSLQRYFPFDLFPWESFLIALWLCTYTEDGRPRWKTMFAMLGRGAGKDGFMAFCSFCLVSPYNPVSRYDVDICANNEEQATRPVKDITDILEAPDLEAKLKKHYYHTKELVQGRKNRGVIRGRTNNPKGRDGMRSGLVIFNEVHIYENYDNIKVFVSGQGKVDQPRVGIITSNGEVSDGPLDDYLARGRRILFDGEPDAGFLPFICCLANKAEVTDPENWTKANPSLPYLPTLQQEIQDEYRDWQEHPAQNADFLPKRMGIRAGYKELVVTDWEKISATNRPLDGLQGLPCVVGIDYAEMSDWVAVDIHFKRGNERLDINHAWICAESKTLPRIKAPWRDWVDRGLCTLVHEPSINPALIIEYIREAGKRYIIKKIAADHFRWTALADEMRKIGFDASDKDRVKLVRPSDIMQADVVIQQCFDNGWFSWGDNPVLRWAVNNTKRLPSSRRQGSDTGNYYYAKIEAKSRKTDPFMALVAAMTIESALGVTVQNVALPPVFVIK